MVNSSNFFSSEIFYNSQSSLQQAEEAKIKVISHLDQVELPLNRGLKTVLNGIFLELSHD